MTAETERAIKSHTFIRGCCKWQMQCVKLTLNLYFYYDWIKWVTDMLFIVSHVYARVRKNVCFHTRVTDDYVDIQFNIHSHIIPYTRVRSSQFLKSDFTSQR